METSSFDIQCKRRKGQPSYLREWLDGITGTAARRGKIGIVVWKHTGSQFTDDEALVVLRFKDWVDYTTGRTHAIVSSDGRAGLDV